MEPAENEAVRAAKHLLFRQDLAELWALAIEVFKDSGVPIGQLMINNCRRCGSPILVGPDREVRTKACEAECIG